MERERERGEEDLHCIGDKRASLWWIRACWSTLFISISSGWHTHTRPVTAHSWPKDMWEPLCYFSLAGSQLSLQDVTLCGTDVCHSHKQPALQCTDKPEWIPLHRHAHTFQAKVLRPEPYSTFKRLCFRMQILYGTLSEKCPYNYALYLYELWSHQQKTSLIINPY